MPEEHQHQHEHPDTAREEESPEGSSPQQQTDQEPVGHRALADALGESFTGLKVAMALLVLLYLAQGFFFADRDEVKIKLRFGRPVRVSLGAGRGKGYVIDSASGWHYAWPWEEVVPISTAEKTLQVEEAFSAGRRRGSGLNPKMDNYLITGDVNIIHMKLRVRYRPRADQQGALDYAFRMLPQETPGGEELPPPQQVLRRLVIEGTIETVSTWNVLEVRSKTRQVPAPAGKGTITQQLFEEIQKKVEEKLRAFEERHGFTVGIELTGIERIGDPEVPQNVASAFDMAQQAESHKQRLIDEGRQRARSVRTNAEGRRAEILGQAQAYRDRLVSTVRADADMLENLLKVYRQSPQKAAILREWHYQRMIEELLGEAEGSFVLHKAGADSQRELWLQLGRAPQKRTEPQRPSAPPAQ